MVLIDKKKKDKHIEYLYPLRSTVRAILITHLLLCKPAYIRKSVKTVEALLICLSVKSEHKKKWVCGSVVLKFLSLFKKSDYAAVNSFKFNI